MTWEQIFGAGSLAVAVAVAYWGYKRGKRSDEVSEQSGINTANRAGTQQIIDGLNAFIDQLQESGMVYRETIAYLEKRLTECALERDLAIKERDRMHRKYGEGEP